MASSASILLEYRFKESWQTTWQLADDERRYSYPPPTPVLPYVDTSLYIMGRTQMAQDKGIKAEFKQQREHMDKRFEEVKNDADKQKFDTDKRFEEAKNERNEMKFDTDKRFEEAKNERNEMKLDFGRRFDNIEARLDNIEARFDNIEARLINSRAFRPGARIEPIGKSIRGEFYPAPNPFPKTIRHFWRLRLPEERITLIRLVHFYEIDVTDWVTWDEVNQDDSETESDEEDSSEVPRKTKRVVNLHPERAIEEVADGLGLDYERIQATMSRADLYQAPVFFPSKRKQSPIADGDRVIKPKLDLPVPQAPEYKVTLKQLLNGGKSSTESQSSRVPTQIGWDNKASFGTVELRRPIRQPVASSGPDSERADLEEQTDGSRKASSKQSEGSANQEKKSDGSRKASSKRSEGSTVPIPSEELRAWENRSGR